MSRPLHAFDILSEASQGTSLLVIPELHTLRIIPFKTAAVRAALFIGILGVLFGRSD
jgi:hypothetical protein